MDCGLGNSDRPTECIFFIRPGNQVWSKYEKGEEIKFDRLGVFTYSEEEGTHGANALEDDVPREVKDERYEQVMLLQQKIGA